MRVTTRRATAPTICRNTTVRVRPATSCSTVMSLRSFSVALSNLYAASHLPGR